MPIYDFACPNGHTFERIVRYEKADEQFCHCGEPMQRLLHKPHCVPDGMYSYAPNLGSATAFEKRRIAMKNGERLINKAALHSDD